MSFDPARASEAALQAEEAARMTADAELDDRIAELEESGGGGGGVVVEGYPDLTALLGEVWSASEPDEDRRGLILGTTLKQGPNVVRRRASPAAIAANIPWGFDFDVSTPRYLRFGDTTAIYNAFGLASADWTFTCWLQFDALTGASAAAVLSSYAGSSEQDILLALLGSSSGGDQNKLFFSLCDTGAGADRHFVMSSVLSANTLYFVEAKHQMGVGLSLSINNGTPVTIAHTGGVHLSPGNVFGLGSLVDGVTVLPMDGYVGQPALWPAYLSGTQRGNLFASGAGVRIG